MVAEREAVEHAHLGFGFRVQGLDLMVSGLGFPVEGCGLQVEGLDLMVSGLGFRVSGCGLRVAG
jgi:hypothetical protein